MKKLLLFLLMAVCCLGMSAQDVIVKKDGSTVLCKVISVSENEVTYAKWSDVQGPQYIMDRTLVANINYQDGRQDKFSEPTTNLYAPGNQQSGVANFNDNALLSLDHARFGNIYLKKAKTLRIIGWTVGGTLFAAGVSLMIMGVSDLDDYFIPLMIGTFFSAGGIATTTGCLIAANKYKKKAEMFAVAPVFQKEFNFRDGSSLSAGVDMIRDRRYQTTTLGLGLQYNF